MPGWNDSQPDGQGPRAAAVTVEPPRGRADTAFHEPVAIARMARFARLSARTVDAAIRVKARQTIAAGVITVSTPTLARGAINTMALSKMIKVAAIFVALGAAAAAPGWRLGNSARSGQEKLHVASRRRSRSKRRSRRSRRPGTRSS